MRETTTCAPRQPLLQLLTLGLLAALLLIPAAPPADGATKDADPDIVQCFTDFPPAGCEALAANFKPQDVEISPDGRQLYVVGHTGRVQIVDRGSDGTLTLRTGPGSCFNAFGTEGCTEVNSLSATFIPDLTISPDGTSVYVATGSSVANFVRDPASGNLTPTTCIGSPGQDCPSQAGLVDATYAAVVSPDSLSVYVRSGGRLLAYDRDPATGLLTLKAGATGCYTEADTLGCTDAVGLTDTAYAMVISPDGKSLYVPNTNGVAVFTRGAGGSLSQAAGPDGGCLTADGSSTVADECQSLGLSGPAMVDAWATTVSPSGKHVFVAGSHGSLAFSRNASTGALTLTDCLAPSAVNGCQTSKGSGGMGVQVSPDGTRAIVGGSDIAGFGVYDFDEATGHLTQLAGAEGCFSGNGATGCTPIAGGPYGKSAWASDGLTAYVVPQGSLLALKQDLPPVCQSASATAAYNTPLKLTLSCIDPNGDAFTINAPAQTTAGQLGTVDQATDSVLYSPLNGFVGGDSFTFTATADGLTSAPATVSITVQQAMPAPPPSVLDQTVKLNIRTKTLQLDDKGKAKVKLTCPANEKSGPCTGKLKVKTQGKVPFEGTNKVVVLAVATYSVNTGTTKAVVVKLTGKIVKLVTKHAAARKLRLIANVKDTAGNKAIVKSLATLKLPG